MRKAIVMSAVVVLGLGLALAACKQATDSEAVTNLMIDNTVGTASDRMTDVDAATGAATNMAPDVGDTQPGAATSSKDNGDAESDTTGNTAK